MKAKFTLKNEIDIDEKSGENDNVLNWTEDDFYDFGDEFMYNVEK